MGPRSVLLLEGADHLSRRKAMLPPFHGERMRAYEAVITEAARAEIERWPRGERFAIHPRMQALTLEVILRAVFGVTDPERRERLRGLLGGLLDKLASPRLQLRMLVARRLGAIGPAGRDPPARPASVDELIYAEIAERRADPGSPSATTSSRCWPRPASRTASRSPTPSFATSSSPCCSRATRRPRPRSPGPSTCCCETPRRSRAFAPSSPRAATSTCARRSPSRCACARSSRSRAGGWARSCGSASTRCPPAPTSPRRSGSPTPGPTSTRNRSSSAPSASSPTLPRPTRGCRSAAACGAASAPRSPSSRCASCCARCSRAASCAAPARRRSGSRGATSPSRRATARRSPWRPLAAS